MYLDVDTSIKKDTEDQGAAETFFNQVEQQFKENLTPLILKFIKTYECLCDKCNPVFGDAIYTQAYTKI